MKNDKLMRVCIWMIGLLLGFSQTVYAGTTVLTLDGTRSVTNTLVSPNHLWVAKNELPLVNGFELKPQGACLDEICIPIKQDRDSEIFVVRGGTPYVNVSELAERIQQPIVADHDANVWSLGAIPVQRQSFVRDGVAPDFTLPDWRGDAVSLSDFKGKNIMLLSWASW